MPLKRHLRLAAAAAVLAGVVAFGLADWSSSTSGAYVVRPGDSLWSIATSRGITVDQLAGANHLDPADILLIGTHLVIPSDGSGEAQEVAAAVPASSGSSGTQNAQAFCASFEANPGPWGELPSQLAGSSTYYRLLPIFEHWASYYGVSLPLVEAVDWQESGWQQGVVSPTGAVGVGQVEPYTATFIQTYLIGESLNLQSVSDNIRMSAAFLNYLAHIEGDNRCETIAAYYEGPLNLQTLGILPSAQQYVADVEALEPRFE